MSFLQHAALLLYEPRVIEHAVDKESSLGLGGLARAEVDAAVFEAVKPPPLDAHALLNQGLRRGRSANKKTKKSGEEMQKRGGGKGGELVTRRSEVYTQLFRGGGG